MEHFGASHDDNVLGLPHKTVLSIIEWDCKLRLGRVISQRGNEWRSLGHMVNGVMYVYPEEILFLAEKGVAAIQDHKACQVSPLEILCAMSRSEIYEPFKRLRSLGYILWQPTCPYLNAVQPDTSNPMVDFLIYLPNATFRKSDPGVPWAELITMRPDDSAAQLLWNIRPSSHSATNVVISIQDALRSSFIIITPINPVPKGKAITK